MSHDGILLVGGRDVEELLVAARRRSPRSSGRSRLEELRSCPFRVEGLHEDQSETSTRGVWRATCTRRWGSGRVEKQTSC
jgi:hypothetical protein